MTTLPPSKKTSTKKPATKKSATPSVPSKGVLSFSELLSASWQRLKNHKKALLLPAIISIPGSILQNIPDSTGGDSGEATDTLSDVVSFIPKAFAEGGLGEGGLETGLVIAIVALVFFIFLFLMILQYIAYLYSLLVIYDEHKNWRESVKRSFGLFFPYIGLNFWILLRTYIWIPLLVLLAIAAFAAAEVLSGAIAIVGVVLCIVALFALLLYFSPRLGFAEVIYLREKKGIKESVHLSWQRTEGYWGKVVGNGILYSLCVFGIVIAALIALAIVAVIAIVAVKFVSDMVGGAALIVIAAVVLGIPAMIVFVLAMQYLKYWGKCFSYEMARTIFANPLTVKSSKK